MGKIFLMIMTLALVSNPLWSQQMNHSSHSSIKSGNGQSLTASNTKMLKGVLEKNDDLYKALLSKDDKLISDKARDLKIFIHSHGHNELLADLHKKLGALDAIVNLKDTKTALNAYAEFISPLADLVKKNDIGQSYNVFFCPMAKKSWIQETSKMARVQNVYLPEMLECGEQVTKNHGR